MPFRKPDTSIVFDLISLLRLTWCNYSAGLIQNGRIITRTHRHERWHTPLEQMHQGFRGRHVLLTSCRQITAHATEDLGSFKGSKTTRYFLLYFEHTDVSLTLVVGKRYLWTVEEAQHIRFVGDQPFQQVAGPRAFEPPALALALGGGQPPAASALSVMMFSRVCIR